LKIHYIKGRPYFGLDDGLALVCIVLGIVGFIPGPFPYFAVLTDFYIGMRSELVGIGLAVIIIANANDWMNRRAEKDRLILQMGSPDNAAAIEAVRQLRSRGWLFDGTLRRAHLVMAELSGANLFMAKLFKAELNGAELNGADLRGADLRGAYLVKAELNGAKLNRAYLFKANLFKAKLSGVRYTTDTTWPIGWDKEKRDKAGAINVDEQEQ